MRKIDTIAIHQTGTPTGTVETIRRYHQQVRGYADIGYHWIIYADGTVHPGRPLAIAGAHVKGANAASVGVCCVGAGNALPVGGGYMTEPMWRSLGALVKKLRARFGVPISNIKGHREFPSGKAQGKTCPGWNVSLLRALLAKGAIPC